MPRLACWSCGRQLYTVAPIESLFAEERRCPRCGAFLSPDRRETNRRVNTRRQGAVEAAGPPDSEERRIEERRRKRRRKDTTTSAGRADESAGWID